MQKVQRGEPLNISANDWNAIADTVNGSATSATGRDIATGNSPLGSQWVWIKNTSGSDRARWDCMSLSSAVFTIGANGQEDLAFSAVAATASGTTVVLLEPIANGRFGRAAIAGFTLAKLATAPTSGLNYAVPNGSGNNLLPASNGSVRLLDQGSTSGTTVRPVLLGSAVSNPKALTTSWTGRCVWPDCFSGSSPKRSLTYSSQKGDWNGQGVEIINSPTETGGKALKFHNASTWLFLMDFAVGPVDAGYTDGWVAGQSIAYNVYSNAVVRPNNGLLTPALGGTGVTASSGAGYSQAMQSGNWIGAKVFAANDVWDLFVEARMWRMDSFADTDNPKVGIGSLSGALHLIRIDDSLSTYSVFVDAGIIP